jgi:hypothetical protein
MPVTRDTRDANRLFDDRYEALLGNWNERRDRYRENYRQILAKPTAGPYNSKISTKYTASQLRVHTSFSSIGVLPSKPWVEAVASQAYRMLPAVNGLGEPTVVDAGEWSGEEYQERLEEATFFYTVYRWYRLAGAYGVGIVKQSWAGGVAQNLVNPADLAWDPKAHNLRHDAGYVIERSDRQTLAMIYALRQARGGDYNDKAVAKLMRLAGKEQSHSEDLQDERTGESTIHPVEWDEPITLHHMVTPDRIITKHIDTDTILRDRPNPLGYINYYDLSPYPEVFQVQGYSVPELLEGIQSEINTIRQQRTDIRSLQANPILLARRGATQNIRTLKSRPGAVWPVTNVMEDYKWMQMQDSGQPLVQEEAILASDGDRATGIMPHSRGERGAEMKATVANILHTNVNVRFASSLKADMDYPFQVLLNDFIGLCQLYERPTKITEQEWAVTRKAVEEGSMRLRLKPETHVGNPFAKIQVLQQIATWMAPFTMPPGLALMGKMMLRLADIPDADDIMRFVTGIPMQPQGSQPALGAPQGMGVAQGGEMARGRAPGQPAMTGAQPA